MATTQNEHPGDGSDRRFPFTFPYIKEDDVKVSLRTSTADVTTIASTEYTFPSATEIQFNALSGAATTFQETTGAPKNGVTIRIFRDTDLETQRVTFFPGSSIRAQDLNDNTLQNLYASQERQSRAVDSTGGALTGNLTLNAADIVFEGDTADDFETTLTVVDPTADRTITLPNVTGTVITTGDTATITDALLAGSSVTTAKIAADAVDGTKIADNAIDSEHYVDGSIDRVHLAADIVDGTKIADNSIDSEHYVDGSIDTVHLASLIGTGIPSTNVRTPVISVNIKGQVTSIQSSDIAESDIASNAVTTAKIDNDAVTAAKIAANAITEDGGQLANDSVVTAKIKDLNVTTGKLAADAVTGAKIADDAVDSEHIAAGAIDLEHMSVNSVDSDQYVDGSIDTAHIGDQQITAGKLATNAVTTAKINADAVTNAKIADNAVQKENINGLTADISDLNQIDGKTLVTSATWTSDTQFPSANAIDARITARIDPIDGFVAIANEDSFPTTTPPEGTAVSISNAGGMVIGASASTTDASRDGVADTVTIQNIPANMQSQTIQDGIGMIVIATSTSHTYDFHRVIATNADVIALSDDINDFNNRYRVGNENPSTDNDEGDLFYNTGSDKMLVWDGSEWDEVQSIGEYFIIPDSDFPTWNGTLNDISISSNAPANAEQIILSINGVIQEPNSGTARPSAGFSLNGSTIQLSAAPATGSEAWGVIIGSTVNIGTPSAGTVGTTQLADGAVTNVKVATDAAIAGTKIDPDFGSQDIVTTGHIQAGGGNGPNEGFQLPDDGGTARPRITNDGDNATVIRAGSATGGVKFNNFANSSELIEIDNTGRLLVGTSTARTDLSTTPQVQLEGTSFAGTAMSVVRKSSDNGRPSFIFGKSRFVSSSPSVVSNDDGLGTIEWMGHDGTNFHRAAFIGAAVDAVPAGDEMPGRLFFSTSDQTDSVPTERMRIDRLGRVLIGRTSSPIGTLCLSGRSDGATNPPFLRLDVHNATPVNGGALGVLLFGTTSDTDDNRGASIAAFRDGGTWTANSSLPTRLTFSTTADGNTDPVERMRLSSTGQLSVLGSTESFDGSGDVNGLQMMYETDQGVASIGSYSAGGNTNLRFFTNSGGADGTEVMRLDDSGRLLVNGGAGATSGIWHQLATPNSATSGNNFALRVHNRNTNASAATRGIQILHGLDPNDTNAALEFIAGSTTRCIIRNNGGIGNFQANDSNLSDERMKKNIVGVDTQWDVVKSWEVKKFNFNFESDSDPLHIGAIAQQIETISPEVVTNFDNETDTKSLKEQQMMWMAIKALQEAQARIETLEEKVATLEGGE
jgi:hypothetical protein